MEDIIKVVVPAGPVGIVTRVRRRGVLASISPPKVMDEEDEIGTILSCSAIV